MKQANTYHIQNRNYRNSFQGQEHHDEIRGKGNYINYKYRGHDPRIGRLDWLVDPLAKDYPWNSPYAFSENSVIHAVELEGLEKFEIIDNNGTLNLVYIGHSDYLIVIDENNKVVDQSMGRNFKYKDFQRQMQGFVYDQELDNYILKVPNIHRDESGKSGIKNRKIVFTDPRSTFSIQGSKGLVNKKRIGDGYISDGYNGEGVIFEFPLNKPLYDSKGNKHRDKIVPDNFDFIDIYLPDGVLQKDILEELNNQQIELTGKDVNFIGAPYESESDSIEVTFGIYE